MMGVIRDISDGWAVILAPYNRFLTVTDSDTIFLLDISISVTPLETHGLGRLFRKKFNP